MSNTKYALKIESSFNEKEIAKAMKVFNCDEAREYLIEEENLVPSQPSQREGEIQNSNFISHTIINLNASGASARFVGRYKSEDALSDVSCTVNHNASDTKSDINIKGIAKIGGKIISRSKINVKENLKNIVGNENAKFIFVAPSQPSQREGEIQIGEIDAIPSLDINSNDVLVNHSLSISKIKEADIWYVSLHGSSEQEAKLQFEESFLK